MEYAVIYKVSGRKGNDIEYFGNRNDAVIFARNFRNVSFVKIVPVY